jgi:ribonuclease HI
MQFHASYRPLVTFIPSLFDKPPSLSIVRLKLNTITFYSFTDASVINGNATWAFTIATPDGYQLTSQSGRVRGHNITSFRAELSGILAATSTRDFAPDTKYTVYCDNQAVITQLNTMKSTRPQVSWSDYDLLYTCLINYPKHVLFEHVKGHQDALHQGQELSFRHNSTY